MTRLDSARCGGGCLADVHGGRPLSAQLPVGDAIYAVTGELWITQEGLYDDVVLAAGERFDVERRGLVVVSAVGGAAVAYFTSGSATGARRGIPATSDVLAHALRRREIARLARAARATLGRLFRRLRLTIRTAFT